MWSVVWADGVSPDAEVAQLEAIEEALGLTEGDINEARENAKKSV
jgi:hypothetical protein